MAKRSKRAEKSIESLKEEIEKHFNKLEADIVENNLERGRYHYNEINLAFLPALEKKLKIAGKTDSELLEYKKRLDSLKKRLNFDNA